MFKRLCLLAMVISSGASKAYCDSVTDLIFSQLANKNLPQQLHQAKDTPWQYGTYNLQVNRAGQVSLSSNANDVRFTLPMTMDLDAIINKTFLGSKLLLNCSAQLKTEALLIAKPNFSQEALSVQVEIDIPVPPTDLRCEGLRIPIKPILEEIIADEKIKFQNQMETEIRGILIQAGL